MEGAACADTGATREEDAHSACQKTQLDVRTDKRFDVINNCESSFKDKMTPPLFLSGKCSLGFVL